MIAAFPRLEGRLRSRVRIERRPAILAIGEYLRSKGVPNVQTAVKRFTTGCCLLKGKAGALVLETLAQPREFRPGRARGRSPRRSQTTKRPEND